MGSEKRGGEAGRPLSMCSPRELGSCGCGGLHLMSLCGGEEEKNRRRRKEGRQAGWQKMGRAGIQLRLG